MVSSRFQDPYAYLTGEPRDTDLRGLKCELKTYDARYNSKGELVTLEAGTRHDLDPPERGGESALVLIKFYAVDGKLEDTELVVKSPYLLTALRKVISYYPGVNLSNPEIVFPGLPTCLFHYRTELLAYGNSLRETTAIQHFSLLLNHMWKIFETQMMTYSSLMETPLGLPLQSPGLGFDHLWMVFRPGCFIYVQSSKPHSVMRLKRMDKIMHAVNRSTKIGWDIIGEQITYNGTDFGYKNSTLSIRYYEEHRSLDQLEVYPLQYSSKSAEIRRKMISRGQKFVALRGVHYKSYRGAAEALAPFRNINIMGEQDVFPLRSTPIDGRIIIDAATFSTMHPAMEENFSWDSKPIKTEDGDLESFSDDDFLICKSRMPGFSLTKKRWCYFEVDCIEDVELNPRAFDRLFLADGQKKTILSLVQAHTNETSDFDDVIKGKGKGMVFLLHGVPGVGKTLTAESVADCTRKPLYTITCGELGVEAASIEERLSKILHLATIWDAVLLLDEADIFLEQRSTHELDRNGIVSIFLRLLEYYEGLLFLTTNRISTFDVAIKSRIHLAIKYHPMSFGTRRDLWRSFISSTSQNTEPSWLDDTGLDELASEDLNGRQIKNVVRTAQALAVDAGDPLNRSHLDISLNATKLFEKDIAEVAQRQIDQSAEDRPRKRPRFDEATQSKTILSSEDQPFGQVPL